MPRCYGVTYNVVFRQGVHPPAKRVEGLDGVTRCEDVMKWYVRKVRIEYAGCPGERLIVECSG
jgi:hypothetical protein